MNITAKKVFENWFIPITLFLVALTNINAANESPDIWTFCSPVYLLLLTAHPQFAFFWMPGWTWSEIVSAVCLGKTGLAINLWRRGFMANNSFVISMLFAHDLNLVFKWVRVFKAIVSWCKLFYHFRYNLMLLFTLHLKIPVIIDSLMMYRANTKHLDRMTSKQLFLLRQRLEESVAKIEKRIPGDYVHEQRVNPENECCICMETKRMNMLIPCAHECCASCLQKMNDGKKKTLFRCPVCKMAVLSARAN